jgi:hypothetical protein
MDKDQVKDSGMEPITRLAHRLVRHAKMTVMECPETILATEAEWIRKSNQYDRDEPTLVKAIEDIIVNDFDFHFSEVLCGNCEHYMEPLENPVCPLHKSVKQFASEQSLDLSQVLKKSNTEEVLTGEESLPDNEQAVVNLWEGLQKHQLFNQEIAKKCKFYAVNDTYFNNCSSKIVPVMNLLKAKYSINRDMIMERINKHVVNFVEESTRKEFGQSIHVA